MKYIIAIILFATLYGCGSTRMSYSPSAMYSENDIRDINDDDILKAFEAEPQIVLPTKIAWYNMSHDTLYKSLFVNNDDVTLNYIIPKSLIEGFFPYIGDYYESYYYYSRPTAINIKALRLLAARAKCDLIILVITPAEVNRISHAIFSFVNSHIFQDVATLVRSLRKRTLAKTVHFYSCSWMFENQS